MKGAGKQLLALFFLTAASIVLLVSEYEDGAMLVAYLAAGLFGTAVLASLVTAANIIRDGQSRNDDRGHE